MSGVSCLVRLPSVRLSLDWLPSFRLSLVEKKKSQFDGFSSGLNHTTRAYTSFTLGGPERICLAGLQPGSTQGEYPSP